MGINLGSIELENAKYGTQQVEKIMMGSSTVWENLPPYYTLDRIDVIPNYSVASLNNSKPVFIDGDSDYIYVVRTDTPESSNRYIYKIDKVTKSVVATSSLIGVSENQMAYSFILDSTYLYIANCGTSPFSLRKYNKSDLSLAAEATGITTNTVGAISQDDNYIYTGDKYGTSFTLRKYNKSNLSLVTQSSVLSVGVNSIIVNGTDLVVAEDSVYLRIYSTSTMALRTSSAANSSSNGTGLNSIAVDPDENIYVYNQGSRSILKFDADGNKLQETISGSAYIKPNLKIKYFEG